jgi:hypothetical protein
MGGRLTFPGISPVPPVPAMQALNNSDAITVMTSIEKGVLYFMVNLNIQTKPGKVKTDYEPGPVFFRITITTAAGDLLPSPVRKSNILPCPALGLS